MRAALRKIGGALVIYLSLVVILASWTFPYATDLPVAREEALREFYEHQWGTSKREVKPSEASRLALNAWNIYRIPERVGEFVETYDLHDKKVLDVGSGAGYLQDLVDDYTGLDIASSAARFYHKPFVAGTATAMPFDDDAFDAAWSIWVLEHIPNPESALREIRRVVKPGGLLYLLPAWHCVPWAAEGYDARPYSDFGLAGKLVKASIPLRRSGPFQMMTIMPARVVRSATGRLGPTRLHYKRLTPNYEEYWQADSDAVNSLDPVEVAMWFESRGDTCLNCARGFPRLLQGDGALIIRIGQKPAGATVLKYHDPKPTPFSRRPNHLG